MGSIVGYLSRILSFLSLAVSGFLGEPAPALQIFEHRRTKSKDSAFITAYYTQQPQTGKSHLIHNPRRNFPIDGGFENGVKSHKQL
jgi:hypothetical protein